MKKLIIAAAIVCAAVVSQAAAVGWSMSGASDYAGGNYKFFVLGLNGATDADSIASLIGTKGWDAVSSMEFASGSVLANGAVVQAANTSGKSITYKEPPATAADNTYEGVIFVLSTDGKTASYTALNEQVLANNSTSKAFAFGAQGTNLANNKFAVAPEPTSGLLLLLGVAGLALKRRRA